MKQRLGKRAKKELVLVDALARAIDRPDLATILEGAAATDPRLDKMLGMMFDPAHASKKLATMARECGLSYTELTDVIKKHRLAEGLVRMTEHVPQVMQDVATDALNSQAPCSKCEGDGSVIREVKTMVAGPDGVEHEEPQRLPFSCKHCNGTGWVTRPGDAGARKLVFDSMGLTGGRGPLIAVQNNTLNAGDGDDLESILAMGKRKALPQPQVTVEQVKDGE